MMHMILRKIVNDFCSSVEKLAPYSQLLDFILQEGLEIVNVQAFRKWLCINCPAAVDRLNFDG